MKDFDNVESFNYRKQTLNPPTLESDDETKAAITARLNRNAAADGYAIVTEVEFQTEELLIFFKPQRFILGTAHGVRRAKDIYAWANGISEDVDRLVTESNHPVEQ